MRHPQRVFRGWERRVFEDSRFDLCFWLSAVTAMIRHDVRVGQHYTNEFNRGWWTTLTLSGVSGQAQIKVAHYPTGSCTHLAAHPSKGAKDGARTVWVQKREHRNDGPPAPVVVSVAGSSSGLSRSRRRSNRRHLLIIETLDVRGDLLKTVLDSKMTGVETVHLCAR